MWLTISSAIVYEWPTVKEHNFTMNIQIELGNIYLTFWYVFTLVYNGTESVLLAVSRLAMRSNLKSDIVYSVVKDGNLTAHIGT